VIERIERGIETLKRERESKVPEQRDGMRENLRKIYEEEGTELFEPLFLLPLVLLTSML